MRSYVITSGALFGLLFLVHVARVVAEGTGPLRDPFFAISSLAALAMAAWSLASLRRRNDGGAN